MRIALVLAMLCASASAGPVEAQLVVDVDLTNGHFAQPISFSPDVWWGVAPRWTLGLVHSAASVDRFEAGPTLCLRSNDPLACTQEYRGSGLDARYDALPWLAPRVRFLLRDIDPMKPAVTVGALLRGRAGRFSIESDPYLQIGLANRDRGNDHAIMLPVRGAVDLGCWRAWLDTGWNTDLTVWRDGWHVPLGVGTRARVGSVDVGGEFAFPSLLGPQNTPKERVLLLFVATRWQP